MPGETPAPTLQQLGWSSYFAQQLSESEHDRERPGRVFAVQRRSVTVMHEAGASEAVVGGRFFQQAPEARPTIGDWVLIDPTGGSVERVLERKSLLKRVAAGREHEVQLMAANVDTLLLVSACNDEFNPSRLERYLALALDAGVEPVVVLTKSDLAESPDRYVDAVRALKRDLPVELVDARDAAQLVGVLAWCAPGQTVALMGSSGVGKSTLVNTLSGAEVQLTAAARDDDAKGRHTTTRRSLHLLPGGALLVDNPGMRELALGIVDASGLFEDVEALATACRFRDCRHLAEPGCAVQAAIAAGDLDARRLDSYRKLARDEMRLGETLAQSRARFRALGKKYRQVQKGRDEGKG